MKRIFPVLICIGLIFIAFKCDDDSDLTLEQEQKQLISFKQTILDLANTSVCTEYTECKFIAFGSKPCGGPWSYLIYSTSIDTEQLETMVENYNQKEATFNDKYGIFSDCSVVIPPSDFTCENNHCVPIY